MSDRDLILDALPDASTSTAAPFRVEFAPIADLWIEFQTQLELLGGRLVSAVEANDLLQKPRWCDPILNLPNTSETIWSAELGVSQAIAAVAKSGTLILESGPDCLRLSSLVPPINLIIIDKANIVPTLHEAMPLLSQRTTVFVTGPSRTADIEGVMVRGVHGPGQLLVHVREA